MSAIIDTGAIVGLLDRNDSHHEEARTRLAALPRPWLTCEAVLSETHFLLSRFKLGSERLGELLARNAVVIGYSMRGDEAAIISLLRKYASVPITVADACLLRMCDLDHRARLLTFDSDFKIYRLGGRKLVPLAMGRN